MEEKRYGDQDYNSIFLYARGKDPVLYLLDSKVGERGGNDVIGGYKVFRLRTKSDLGTTGGSAQKLIHFLFEYIIR